jgi:hypothetical protein
MPGTFIFDGQQARKGYARGESGKRTSEPKPQVES